MGGETVNAYVAELRKLTEFGAYLNEALRDRFVCGITSEQIQRKLLSEAGLTLDKALKIGTQWKPQSRMRSNCEGMTSACIS